jgi:hypothetical protein
VISSAASQAPAEANDVTLAEMDEAIAKLQLWRINRAKETCESLNGLVPTAAHSMSLPQWSAKNGPAAIATATA